MRKVVDWSKKIILKLQREFVTDVKIGKHLGVTRQAIQLVRKRFGVPAVIPNNRARNKEIHRLFKKGESVKDIADGFDLSVPQTYRLVK